MYQVKQCKRLLSFQLLFIQIVLLVIAFNVAAFQGDFHDEDFHQEHLISRTVQLRTVELKVKQYQPNFDGYKARRKLKQQQQQVVIEEKFFNNFKDQGFQRSEYWQSLAPDWWLGPGNVANQYLVILALQKIPKDFKQVLQQTLDDQGFVLSFIPNGTYVIVSTPQPLNNILDLEDVLTITEFSPSYKISSEVDGIYSNFRSGNLISGSSFVSAYEGVSEGFLVVKVEIIQAGSEWIDMRFIDTDIQKLLGGMCGPAYMGMCRWERSTLYNYGITRIPLEILSEVAIALAELPFVHWLEGVERMQVMNFFANSIVQGGTVGLTTTHRPFWDAGLTGAGQLVGVGDTGLDFDSCFFRDSNVSQPGLDHRKVIAYRTIGDQLDGSGHGTHVCGTIAGSVAEGRAQNHNGLAPDAKIAFTDLGTGRDKFLKLPEEGMERYYRWGYDMGVRLHSDSWGGGPSGGYRQTSRDADRFMWEHPDFLAILAAGNEGEAYGEQATINSLAACKNAVAVGATLGPFGTLPKVEAETVYLKTVQPEDVVEFIKAVKADFGPRFEDVLQEPSYEITNVTPATGCVNVTDQLPGENYQGKIVLVARGECKYLDKVLAAQRSGAVGIIIYNVQDQRYGYSTMMIPQALKGNTTVYIPAANIPLSTAQMLLRHLERTRLFLEVLQSSVVEKNIGVVERFDNIAKFSSFGPTDDDRIKPDLVAPGEAIRSAYGDGNLLSNNCQTAQLTGTSMATPIVAGAALLVRQYFVDGFYPSQSANSDDSFFPSSALIKAVLINGAIDLKGVSETGLPLENSPSIRQGWGRVNLGSSLPLANTTSFSLYISDDVGLAQDENFYLCVQIPPYIGEHPLTATLVWTDPPADLPALDQILVNDLDLKIISPPGLPKSSRGAAPDPDRKNNVEQETVQKPVPNSSYFVLVNAFQVPWPRNDTNDQPFALVITGPPGMVVEECEDVCTSCPSSPAQQNSLETQLEEAGDVSQGNISVIWNQTVLQFDDPCLCSENGVDVVTGVDSMRRGCARHALEFGVEMRYCYVVDSIGCGKGAYASRRIPGVAWRECNLFEEMYSMAIPWVPVGTNPQFVQDEDIQQMNATQDVITEVEEFENQILNLTVILEPIVPSILVPMDQTTATDMKTNQEQIPPSPQIQQLSISQTPDAIFSFQDLFNVTWQVNQNYNNYERAISTSQNYDTKFSNAPDEFQDELSLLQLQVSPPQQILQNQTEDYLQLDYNEQQQQQELQLSGLAAIQAFQYNPRNFTVKVAEEQEIGTVNAEYAEYVPSNGTIDAANVRNVSFQLEPMLEVLQADDVTFVPITSNVDYVPGTFGTQYLYDVTGTLSKQNSDGVIGDQSGENFKLAPIIEVFKSEDATFVPISPNGNTQNALNVTNAQNVQNSIDETSNVVTSNLIDVTLVPIAQYADDVMASNVVHRQNVQNSQHIPNATFELNQLDVTVDEAAFVPITFNTNNIITTDVATMQNFDTINATVTSSTNDVTQSSQISREDELYHEPIAEIEIIGNNIVNYKNSKEQDQVLTVTVDIQTKEQPLNEQGEYAPLWYSVWGVEENQQISEQQDGQIATPFSVQQNQMQLLEGLIELAQVRDDFNG